MNKTATEILIKQALPTKAEIALRRKSFMQAIEPLNQLRREIYARTLPVMTMNTTTGEITSTIEFSAADKSLLAKIDDLITDTAKQCGINVASQ